MAEAAIDRTAVAARAETREAIDGAAVELFARLGYHATSMRAIAAAAEVQPAAIYHWYAEQGGDPGPAPGRLHGAPDRAGRRPRWTASERPALQLAAAVREHVVFHGIHRREAFVTDSEIRALSDEPRAALIAQRDAYQELFGALIRAGIRDGSLRSSDARVATYAILLQCTGVALWFDPDGPLALEQVAEIHVELVLGSLGAARELIAEAIGARDGERIKPPALPEKATIAVVAPASPPQTRSETEQATAYFEARGHEVVFGPNLRKVHGYLAGTDAERAADLQWALSRARHRHGPHALRRLRLRAPARPDRLGRGRRPAHRLRLLRHHRAAPRARRARGLGHLLRAELLALHAPQGRADEGDRGVVPPRLQARAARPGVRGSGGPVRAHRRRAASPRRRWSAAA